MCLISYWGLQKSQDLFQLWSKKRKIIIIITWKKINKMTTDGKKTIGIMEEH